MLKEIVSTINLYMTWWVRGVRHFGDIRIPLVYQIVILCFGIFSSFTWLQLFIQGGEGILFSLTISYDSSATC